MLEPKTETFAEPAPVAPETQIENPLEALVGEGKKYSTVEELAKGALHAQQHIKTLEEERAEARTIEQLVQELDRRREQETPPTTPVAEPKPDADTPAPGKSQEEELESVVARLLAERESAQTATQNFEQSVTTLDKVYGTRDATNQAVAKRAAELGLSVAELRSQAERSPKAFLTLMGVGGQPNPAGSAPIAPREVATPAFDSLNTTKQVQPGTQAYYRKMQRDDPKRYRSKAVQRQMMEDIERMGEAFFGR